jgi:putative transposase
MEDVLVKICRGMRYRLAPTAAQETTLVEQAHAARALWNILHEWWTWGRRDRRPTLKQADEAIRLARAEIPWLTVLPAQAAQQVLKNYRRAWTNYHEGRARQPTFKSRQRERPTVDVPQAKDLRVRRLNRRWAEVTIIKVGRIRFRWSGPIPGVGREPGRLTGARVLKDAVGWHVAFRTEVDRPSPSQHPGPDVGIDRGITVPLALSDGNDQAHEPWLTSKEAERLLRLERRAARQRRSRQPSDQTSNRLCRTYSQVAALRARAKRRRYDWQHKVTTDIARTYGVVVVEDLHLARMTRSAQGTVDRPSTRVRQKSGLNRALLAEAHARTVDLLTYKLTERGGTLVKIPAAGTSQTCSTCGYRDPASRKGIKFACTSCGWIGHADTNAALNILAAGLAVNGRGAAAVGRGREASTSWRTA